MEKPHKSKLFNSKIDAISSGSAELLLKLAKTCKHKVNGKKERFEINFAKPKKTIKVTKNGIESLTKNGRFRLD